MNAYWPLVDDTWLRIVLAICAVGALGIFLLAVRVLLDGFDEKRRLKADR